MEKQKSPEFRIRVFSIPNDELESIYDDLYEAKYAMLVEEKGLVCCSAIASVNSVKAVWEGLLHIYEGLCYSVDAIYEDKVEQVIGGTFDPDDYEYIEEYIEKLNPPKTYKVRFNYTTYVDVEVEAKSEAEAFSLACNKIDSMDDELYHCMIIDHLACKEKGHIIEK